MKRKMDLYTVRIFFVFSAWIINYNDISKNTYNVATITIKMPYQRSYKIEPWNIYLRIVALAFKDLNVNQFKYVKNSTSSQWSSIKFRCGRPSNWSMKMLFTSSLFHSVWAMLSMSSTVTVSQTLIYRDKKHLWKNKIQ